MAKADLKPGLPCPPGKSARLGLLAIPA